MLGLLTSYASLYIWAFLCLGQHQCRKMHGNIMFGYVDCWSWKFRLAFAVGLECIEGLGTV